MPPLAPIVPQRFFKKQDQLMLWYCWLGVRKSIRPVKIERWGISVVICLDRGADCLHMVQLMPLHPKTPSSLASFKSRLVLPFWHWLTQIIWEKRPLNGCSSSCDHFTCFQPQATDAAYCCMQFQAVHQWTCEPGQWVPAQWSCSGRNRCSQMESSRFVTPSFQSF